MNFYFTVCEIMKIYLLVFLGYWGLLQTHLRFPDDRCHKIVERD